MKQHVWKSGSFSLFAALRLFAPKQRASSFHFQDARPMSKVTTSETKEEPLEQEKSTVRLSKNKNSKVFTREKFEIMITPMQNELKNHNWDLIMENCSKWWKKDTLQTMLMNYFRYTNDFQSAKAYLNYIKLQSAPNFMILANYVALCGQNNEEKEMIDHLEQIPKQGYIDRELTRLVITGLSQTSQWEKALPLLKLYRDFHKIAHDVTWNIVATEAFKRGDLVRGINLLQEVYEDKLLPSEISIEAWILAISQTSDKSLKLKNLVQFLAIARNHQQLFSLEAIESLKTATERDFNFQSSLVKINPTSKVCPICDEKLEILKLCESQFLLLKNKMEEKLLAGEDIYRNSNPQEISNFKKFLYRAKPYNLVVDGLNVAYRKGSKNDITMANQVLKVLKDLRYSKKYEILLVGRKHFLKWPKDKLSQLHQLAQVYLTENLSEDDPFLLLAAISGGPNTNFLSVDLLRNHSYKFHTDNSIQDMFNVWKKTHQVFYEIGQSGLKTFGPKCVDDRCQGNLERGFHIPCSEIDPLTLSQLWLCLKTDKIKI